ncbi:MAG: CinA family nicotinamide mononucleotide deamidase-related protein [Deltaproteobacteria bacterium]|nr:CinA family nicotinamide mononucleotide deamidase-related protein [Deltaproteobacteria bacterium]
MIGEIIAIGDELTSGRILNSTSYFAASHLYGAGHEIAAMATIGDEPRKIGKALKESIERADFVVVTGGLGPTSDDMTNEAVADALNRPTILYPEIFDKIKQSQSFKEMPSLEKLAWLPSGAEILKPGDKIAGYLLVYHDKPIFFLPGVPHQMRELMLDRVIPRLASWGGNNISLVRQKVFKVFGLPESMLQQMLTEVEKGNRQLRIGYYPNVAEVHLSLTVRGKTHEETEKQFSEGEQAIRAILGCCIYADDGETLEAIVGASLRERELTLALAESCTGGLLAHHITSIAGSSDYFLGSIVAYANRVKEEVLQVNKQTLEEFGAVSQETAREMAWGARKISGAALSLSITGIAGPGGGTREKPVGTVCFALAGHDKILSFTYRFSGNRNMVRTKAAMTGLDLLRRHLHGLDFLESGW